jgi:hypothetical protein
MAAAARPHGGAALFESFGGDGQRAQLGDQDVVVCGDRIVGLEGPRQGVPGAIVAPSVCPVSFIRFSPR